ncbi:MAG: tripartite tricarboxylate transporter TctB family protein [Thermodesulfobacteriota bacterium]|nr:tripartite tricarboxylate transporter TctB family protein [Thermodesulfobacteriota bacterium]
MKLLNIKVGFALLMLMVFAYGVYEVKDMVLGAAIFPVAVAGPGLLLVLIQLYREIRISLNPERASDNEAVIDVATDTTMPTKVIYARGLRYLSWILGLYGAIYVIGFKMSIPLFFVLFMRVEGKTPWRVIVPVTLVSLYLIYFHFQTLLGVFWPDSLLQHSGWLSALPWLFQ